MRIDVKVTDSFLNSGLVGIYDKIKTNNLKDTLQLEKNDIKKIKTLVLDYDSYFLQGWKKSNTRNTLINIINDFALNYRCYSLTI